MLIIGAIIFIVLLVIGAPIWLALAAPGGYWVLEMMHLPAQSIPSQFFISVDSWVLLAVPYFLLAGNLMTFMGPSKSLFKFVDDLVGHLPGGLPAVAVVTATIFGALSGSATATVVAVGMMVIPQMLALGYSKEQSMGVVAVSGTLGQMIPPSIYMIIFGSMVQLNIADLFIAGIVPGLVMAATLIIVAVAWSLKEGVQRKEKVSWAQRGRSFVEALPALFMPVLILGGIYGGIFTPTEASAVAIVYVLIISYLFNRSEFTWENVRKSLVGAMATTAIIYIILGGTQLFSAALTFAKVPQIVSEFVATLPVDKWIMMLAVLFLYFILGTVLDPVPILYITVPILYPVVLNLGFDPIHFAVLTVAMMMIAQVTPPVGVSLFALSGLFRVPQAVVVRGAIPYLFAMSAATILLLLVPGLSTFLIK